MSHDCSHAHHREASETAVCDVHTATCNGPRMFRGSSSETVRVKHERCRGARVGVPSSGGGRLKE
eukprot:7359398-Prymnesium_polylepis.1